MVLAALVHAPGMRDESPTFVPGGDLLAPRTVIEHSPVDGEMFSEDEQDVEAADEGGDRDAVCGAADVAVQMNNGRRWRWMAWR